MKNIVIIKITGKNITTFIKRLQNNSIDIYKIEHIDENTIKINIEYKDLETVYKIKTIYKIDIIDYIGINKYKILLKKNMYLIISLFIGILLFVYLLNTIFEIEIIHNDKEIRNLLEENLSKYGLTKYSLKKSYSYIEEVEKKIIDENKEKIEWLEIENVGTKYIIKVEKRVITNNIDDDNMYDIVSSKDAIVKKIIASSGEIVVKDNQYVKKGDVLISQDITLNGEVKNSKSAKGEVYGEVWYNIQVEYPLNYKEEKLTGNKNNTYVLKILNNNLELFKKFDYKKTNDKVILKNNIIPFSLVKQEQMEYVVIDEKLEYEEASEKAIIKAREKMQEKLKDKEYIIYEKCLKNDKNDSTIVVDMFYAVYENITLYQTR